MALSVREKLQLQKIVRAKQAELLEGGLKIREKLAAQKAMREALEKLTVKVADGENAPTLEKLVAGEFDNLPPLQFLSKLEQAVKELDGDIQPVKSPAIKYIEANLDGTDPIMESAFEDFLEAPLAGPGPQQAQPDYSAVFAEDMENGGKRYTVNVDRSFEEPQTFRYIIHAIEQAKAEDEILLKVNSPGGRTDSAQAIYVALRETKAHTKAKIINAASSGSIVSMACDEIEVTPHCTMMIHNASSGTRGKVGDMAAASGHFQSFFKDWYEELYTGFMTPEEISDVAKGQEFWLREPEIKERLTNWKPIRERLKTDEPVGEV